MLQLFSLPTELILNVLLCLPSSSIITCRLVNKYLNTLIRDSVVIRYALALDAAQAEDNPYSTLSKASKLQALQFSEKAWSDSLASFVTSVPVNFHQSGVYDLSSRFLFLGDTNRTLLYSMKLPTRKHEEVKWNEIRTTKPTIDIGLCVYEHDLIAFVTSCPRPETPGTPDSFDIEVELREISTDSPHPLAEKSTLYVMNSTLDKPAVGIEIVGKHLVLVLSFAQDDEYDRVYIFEWQKNIVKASFEADHGTYASLLFLTEDLVLLPNMKASALDIFRIPAVSTLELLVPILRLALPTFIRGHSFVNISCRAEPNPISLSSIPEMKRRASARAAMSGDNEPIGSNAQRAWLANAEDALCLFDLHTECPFYQMQITTDLQFVVHRRAIVAVVDNFSPLNATVTTVPSNSSIIVHTSNPEPSVVPWASWGLDTTSWISVNDPTARWITTSAGQRIVRMRDPHWHLGDDNEPEDEPYIVFDFNQARVERTRKWLEAQPGRMDVRVGMSRLSFGIGLKYGPHDEIQRVVEGQIGVEDGLFASASTSPVVHTDFDNQDTDWHSVSDTSSVADEIRECPEDIETAGRLSW